MLTKYWVEAGENTLLTAAMCIDNPFDLEEATRSFPYHMAIGQKFTGGLIDILRSNKNYFKAKQKGLMSRRLYWQSLFMILKKQYLRYLSTRDVVGNVKIPVLFIQETPKSKTIAPSYQKRKKKKKENQSFSSVSLRSLCLTFSAPSPLSPLLMMLCKIGIEGAKSRCHGRPLLIQIGKSFLTLFLSPCGVRSNICFLYSK
ncbi:hypothetical protein CMV_020567 [Castanea mollissima]|uniref:Uncharacterized protein n=1 Tax=Castanea mollissima TaxID=60419 RepID=A0A8J4VLI9_9ROSI|nr:hypothetical protein CMV_020567 [Castanea mollissima]